MSKIISEVSFVDWSGLPREPLDLPSDSEITFNVVFDPAQEIIPFRRRAVVLLGWSVYEGDWQGTVTYVDLVSNLTLLNRWPRWKAIPFVAYHRVRSLIARER